MADSDNPRGYYEFEAGHPTGRDKSWLPEARGKAVKLALPLVIHLPPGESYRLIVIERDLREVIASQRAMLERLGRSHDGAALDDDRLAAEYGRQRDRLRLWLDRRPEVAVLPLRYESRSSPTRRGTAEHIAAFLGRRLRRRGRRPGRRPRPPAPARRLLIRRLRPADDVSASNRTHFGSARKSAQVAYPT